jgi:hypothetical protein
MEQEKCKIKIVYKSDNRKPILLAIIAFIILASLPSNVKCDTIDTISSIILFFIIAIASCAGIGWWSRRVEANKY